MIMFQLVLDLFMVGLPIYSNLLKCVNILSREPGV